MVTQSSAASMESQMPSLPKSRGRSSTAAIYAAGLILYFCCDLCVGLNNLTPSPITNIAMWAFYLPGQVLIASSANPEVSST